jgi:hypothetical protein
MHVKQFMAHTISIALSYRNSNRNNKNGTSIVDIKKEYEIDV